MQRHFVKDMSCFDKPLVDGKTKIPQHIHGRSGWP